MAVIAHPARYRFTPTEEYALITEFIAHGGLGMEVMTGSHSAAEQVRYADTALEFGLLASRGSDFHSPAREPHRTRRAARPARAADSRCGARCSTASTAPAAAPRDRADRGACVKTRNDIESQAGLQLKPSVHPL